MKRISAILLLGTVLLGTSCKKYLDINQNPNSASASSATPELVLPQAIVYTAGTLNTLNTLGSQLAGYAANAGGYGGFGVSITYNFTTTYFAGLWGGIYDNLEDYQSVLDKTAGNEAYDYFHGAARIMKALNFQLLVDQYNDVPYFGALKGSGELTPSYDKAEDIYKDLASQLDSSIAVINKGIASGGIAVSMATQDVLFHGDMTKWKQLANTIKLRLLIRANGKVNFANSSFDPAGFLTSDALINPGYSRLAGKQNPKWDNWGFAFNGSDANKAWMPNTYIMSYYNSKKLEDSGRGAAIYYQFPNTPTNRLGFEGNTVQPSPSGSFWYPSDNRVGNASGNATGVLKGPNAGYPVITAAESYFLQAEGKLKGIITTGDVKALFEDGIKASYHYLYILPDGSVSGTPDADVDTYIADNLTSPLVNFDLATSDEQKLEAIITQKYIALNMVNSEEAWNEYRRTQYPSIAKSVTSDATATFASTVSEATRPDKLPTRIPYPTSEGSTNTANLPKGISPYTSLIFWAKQ